MSRWRQLEDATSRADTPGRPSKPELRATTGSDPGRKWSRHLRRNLKIAVVACLLADLALLGWLLSPRAPSPSATRQQLAEARLQWVALRAQAGQFRLLNQRADTSQRQIQELMAAGIPEQSEASSKLLTEFSRIAGLSGVQVSGAEFNPDKKSRLGLRRLAISLQVAGDYGGVVRFLNQMERSPMFFILTQVSVSGGSQTNVGPTVPGAASQVKLELQIEAYERVST